MNRTTIFRWLSVLTVLALLSACNLNPQVSQGVTNFNQLDLKASATTPIIKATQNGTGDLAIFYDATTPIFQIKNGGAGYYTGTLYVTTLISQAVGFDTTGDGTVSLPAYTFSSDPDTGLYIIGANNIGLATNGTKRLDVSTTAINAALPVVHAVGTPAAPSIAFAGDTNTGFYHITGDEVGIATNGVLAVDVAANTTTIANKLMGSATEATALFNTTVELTVTQIVNGATVITVPAGRQFRLVSAKAVATAATCTTSTSVDIVANTTHLVAFATASLVRNTVLTDGGTGAAVLADGASYLAQTAGQDITIIGVTGTTAGCTSVIFIINYALD